MRLTLAAWLLAAVLVGIVAAWGIARAVGREDRSSWAECEEAMR